MKIALFSDTYPPEINGVATSTYNLRKTMEDHGHEVLVVTTNPFSKEVSFENGVIRLPGLRLKRLYDYRLSSFYNEKAMRIIVNFRPDIVHCQHDVGVSIFGNLVAAKLHIGSVYTFHTLYEDYAYYVTKGHFDRFARQAIRLYFRGKTGLYDEFIAPSIKTKDYLRSIGIDSTVTVIPTGIEFERFSPLNADKAKTAELRQQFNLSPDDFIVLSLGRIAKEKSIDVVINGFATFLRRYPSIKAKMLVTGWGPAEKELQALAAKLQIADKVIFTGKCDPDQTQWYYHLGNVFASASLSETQGLTFMEAMAAHLPVLARYDDNLAGTVKDGVNGFFFADEEDFAYKLKRIYDLGTEGRKKLGNAASDSIEDYSMEKFYANVYEVYKRVAKKSW